MRIVLRKWPGPTNVVVGGKEIREFWSAFQKHPNDLTIWLSKYFQGTWWSSWTIWRLSNFCWLSSNLKANGNYSQKKILHCEFYACYELLTSWIQSLFQTIQLGNYQTTTKEMFLKTKQVVLEPFVPTGKEHLRNYIRCSKCQESFATSLCATAMPIIQGLLNFSVQRFTALYTTFRCVQFQGKLWRHTTNQVQDFSPEIVGSIHMFVCYCFFFRVVLVTC